MKEPRERVDEFERALAVVVSIAARQTALEGLAEALRLVLAWRNGPEGPEVLFEEGARMIKKAREALDAAKPFLEEE